MRTWSEQIQNVLEVGFELRLIRHEIQASSSSADQPFASAAEIGELLEAMESYIERLAAEFAANKKDLSELQVCAKTDGPERSRRQAEIWERLLELPALPHLLGRSGDQAPSGLWIGGEGQGRPQRALTSAWLSLLRVVPAAVPHCSFAQLRHLALARASPLALGRSPTLRGRC